MFGSVIGGNVKYTNNCCTQKNAFHMQFYVIQISQKIELKFKKIFSNQF